MLYLPVSRTIASSADVTFNKMFYSAIASTWWRFEDGIALLPTNRTIPSLDMVLETTGDITTVHKDAT
jgi:hypothetical protein